MQEERRSHPRIPLENVLYVTLRTGGFDLTCVLLDISISGARLGIAPNEVLPERPVEVEFLSAAPLEQLLNGRKAAVMWGTGVQFGVRFYEPLAARLEDIAKMLDSEIFY